MCHSSWCLYIAAPKKYNHKYPARLMLFYRRIKTSKFINYAEIFVLVYVCSHFINFSIITYIHTYFSVKHMYLIYYKQHDQYPSDSSRWNQLSFNIHLMYSLHSDYICVILWLEFSRIWGSGKGGHLEGNLSSLSVRVVLVVILFHFIGKGQGIALWMSEWIETGPGRVVEI